MNRDTVAFWLKVLVKVLGYVAAAVGGGVATASVAGCKFGSMISIVNPVV